MKRNNKGQFTQDTLITRFLYATASSSAIMIVGLFIVRQLLNVVL